VYQQPYTPYPQQPYGAAANTGGMLAMSIINIFFCTILGIIALVFTLQAKSAFTQQDFDAKMRTAKICNIIGLIGGALSVVFMIIYFVVIAAAIGSIGYGSSFYY
jgi:heme/copper-type cytochrome/quinol oxidase subunit 2